MIMKTKVLTFLSVLISYGFTYAHHEIDEDANFGHLVHFGGAITGVEWAAPHVLIRVVGNPSLANSPQWLVAIESPDWLMSQGIYLENFEILSHISFIGNPSKGGYRSEESVLYGLYIAPTPNDTILVNPNLLTALEHAEGLKAVHTDEGCVFTSDP